MLSGVGFAECVLDLFKGAHFGTWFPSDKMDYLLAIGQCVFQTMYPLVWRTLRRSSSFHGAAAFFCP